MLLSVDSDARSLSEMLDDKKLKDMDVFVRYFIMF